MAPDPHHPLKAPLAYFNDSPRFIAAAAARARPFLGYIHAEITRRGLPYEIALLPIIESAYDPAATSPGGAAGIWQFMPATGRRMGLHLSQWYDGRRDVIASTQAALDYLESLRDRFRGDWLLVFAAYNCGERTVERAIERNQRSGRPSDFWSLELPHGTREYVPKLLALVEIVGHPQAFGVALEKISSAPYFETVDVGGALDLNHVIEWSGMSAARFERLNAGFLKRYAVDGMPTMVLVAHGRAAHVTARLAELPATARQASRSYVVRRGDTLSGIAARTGVRVRALERANGLASTRLSIGQRLVIPTPAAALALTAPTPAPAADTALVHVVRTGDNLWDLARRYATSVGSIARSNGLDTRATLEVGRKLTIARAGAAPRASRHYAVRKGDSLWAISRRFKISVAELKRWNRLESGFLQPGQRLVVAAGDATRDL